MSLTERVRQAGNATVAPSARQRDPELLEELRCRVQALLPSQEIVRLRANNPARAQSEVRTACRRVFDEDPWFVSDARVRAGLTEAFLDEVFGFGPIEWALADDSVTEIMVNGSRSLYIERAGVLEHVPEPFANDEEVRALIDRIIAPLGRRVDESSPLVDARLPQGHRVHAVIPPIAIDGPAVTIRKFSPQVINLAEMEASGSVEPPVAVFLRWLVRLRKNLAVSGGTGSGKTTLLNALSCEIAREERIVTIEDSAELRFLEHPHVVRLESRPPSAEGTGRVTIRDLVRNALRMRPDRIIVGECRGGEALDMLQAMNTGHEGSLTTLHANSPSDCVLRLTTMVRYAVDLPVDVIEAQIGSALDYIVQTVRSADGKRRTCEIDEVRYDREARALAVVPLYEKSRNASAGTWREAPAWLDDDRLSSEEVELWKRQTSFSS